VNRKKINSQFSILVFYFFQVGGQLSALCQSKIKLTIPIIFQTRAFMSYKLLLLFHFTQGKAGQQADR